MPSSLEPSFRRTPRSTEGSRRQIKYHFGPFEYIGAHSSIQLDLYADIQTETGAGLTNSPGPLTGYPVPAVAAFPQAVFDAKLQQINMIAAKGEPVDVVFAGASMVLMGLDPQSFRRHSPDLHTYNAALPSGFPQVQKEWLVPEVVPRVRPTLAVYGLSTVDFWADSGERALQKYRRVAAEHYLSLSVLAQSRQASKLARLTRRISVRRWRDASMLNSSSAPITSGGYVPVLSDVTADQMKTYQGLGIGRYSIGEKETSAFNSTLNDLKAQVSKVVIVDMPMHPGFLSLHPGGLGGYQTAKEHIKALAEASDVCLIDLTSDFEDESLFFDFLHLAPSGAEILSRRLAGRLEQSI